MKINFILFLLVLIGVSSACNKNKCDGKLYGIPVSNTGLDESKCTPVCECEGIESKSFSAEELSLMKQYTNTVPTPELSSNPYDAPVTKNTDGVCAVIIDDKVNKEYHLATYASKEEAINDGAIVTHIDACGSCSSLQDLTVYAENLDVGAAVRRCAILNLSNPLDSLMLCIENIGFTVPCAQIWAYNTKNTQAECFDVCITNNTYNNEDGTLSECLQCDEDKSGPVFKAIAGRTRRNTGIANAICRFCEEVEIVEHNYSLN